LAKFNFDVNLRIRADASDFLTELQSQLPTNNESCPHNAPLPWIMWCCNRHDNYDAVLPKWRIQKHCVDQYVFYEKLAEHMTSDDILVPGSSGACSEVALQTFAVKDGQRVINSPSAGAMGFGLPQAIGVAIASRRRVICVNGDGGFQLNIQELETVRRLNLPIKFFVLNNQGYASMRATSRNHFKGRMIASGKESGLTLPSVTQQADAHNISNALMYFNGSVDAGIECAFAEDGPFITEVIIDQDAEPQPRVKSKVDKGGKMVSGTLHDMWPYLSKKELAKNMICN
jgi:acetolactate synthase-1/2/3 large subunit